MKYVIQSVRELGAELLPCYEVVVCQYPNLLEMFLGARQEENKYVSDIGFDWYKLPKYEKVPFNSKLDKVLLEIPQTKRTRYIQKLFDSIQELKTKAIFETLNNPNKEIQNKQYN